LNLDPGRTQNQQNKAYLMVGLAALVAGNNVEVEKALSLMTNGPEKTKFNRYKTYGSEVLSRYLDQDLEDGPFKVYINSISANSGSAQGVNGELSDAIANKDYQKAIGMIGDNTPQKDDVLFWMALAAR
jgi:hypothetical protein